MRTKCGTPERLRWPASEGYGVSRSSNGLQTASAKSMMRQRSQNHTSQAVTRAGRKWPDKSENMDVHFTPEVEAKLTQSAAQQGRNPDKLVQEVDCGISTRSALHRNGESWRGSLVAREQVGQRLERVLQP